MKHNREILLIFLIFIIIFITHSLSKVKAFSDSRWVIHTALSLVNEGNINLDEYRFLIEKENFYAIEEINGHLYNYFPYGTSILISPLVFLIQQGLKLTGQPLTILVKRKNNNFLQVILASFIVALTGIFIYLIGKLFFKKLTAPILLVFIFAFCSPAWSTASRALFQHGPSMLMLSLSLYLFLLAEKKPSLVKWISIPLGFSYVIRPTNIISLVVFSIFIFLNYRKQFLKFITGILIIIILFFFYNYLIYNSILPAYYLPRRITGSPYFIEALFGNLISPARGLFVFSPVFLFSFLGIWFKIKNLSFQKFDFSLIVIIFCHWLVISLFPKWWGGFSYGPRFFSDIIPYLIYFLIPFLIFLQQLRSWPKKFLISSFIMLILISFLIHLKGATCWRTLGWNQKPYNIDEHPWRLWDWSDLQFFR